ncbi:MAG: glycosyltransferase [Candidatus Berkelbacteria bacterium]
MKIALVHDFLNKPGGAEKVLLALAKMYPEAPIYTLVYDPAYTSKDFPHRKIIASSLQNYPEFIRKRLKFLLPKMSSAIEEFDFTAYDAVISSSNSFAHGIITTPKTFHLCYCHSPMRYAWDWSNEYLAENNVNYGLIGFVVRSMIAKIRQWDRIVADRVDAYVANSINVAGRIKKYYRLDSTVVYPPVETEQIAPQKKNLGYYMISSRLEPYKKVDLAVKVFNKNGLPLWIVGDGSQLEFLRSVAKDNIKFLGWQKPSSVFGYLSTAKAFVFPGEDDFGIAPVEALAAGLPVIAHNKGGVRETVKEGKTGFFFDEQTVESMSEAVDKLEANYTKIDKNLCRESANQFSTENFEINFKRIFDQKYQEFRRKYDVK